MKRTGPTKLESSRTKRARKITKLSVNNLPKELFAEIFAQLGLAFDDLATLRLVNKEFKLMLDNHCRSLINQYFPYLEKSGDYNENPLNLLNLEYRNYINLYPQIDIALILDALAGNSQCLTAVKDKKSRTILSSLLIANEHHLADISKCASPRDAESGSEIDSAFDSDIPSHLFALAAFRGNFCFIEKFDGELCSQGISEALTNAADQGHGKIVKFLLDKYTEPTSTYRLTKEDIQKAIPRASKSGMLEVLNLLIAHHPEVLSKHTIRDSILLAAEYGHLRIVQFYLDNYLINANLKLKVLGKALTNGHLTLAVLIEGMITDNVDEICDIIENHGFKSIDFYTGRCKQRDDVIEMSFNSAAAKGYHHIVTHLLNTYELRTEATDSAFLSAVDKNRVNILKLLPNYSKDCSTLIKNTANNGHLDTVDFLASKTKCSSESVCRAYVILAKNQEISGFNLIAKLKDLDAHKILEIAIEEDHLEVFQYFLTQAHPKYHNTLIEKAIAKNQVEYLKRLISHFKIDINNYYDNFNSETSYSLLEYAALYNSPQVIQFLLDNTKWDGYRDTRRLRAQDNAYRLRHHHNAFLIQFHIDADRPLTLSETVSNAIHTATKPCVHAFQLLSSVWNRTSAPPLPPNQDIPSRSFRKI